jgi:hypothetical protein
VRRIFIIVEGQTEEEFVKTILRDYLLKYGITDVRPIKIQTSKGHKGGFLKYAHLKQDIEKLNKSQSNILITTFVDYFRIPVDLPGYKAVEDKIDSTKRVEYLEESMKLDTKCLNNNIILPYIQVHEFEALLFSSIDGFKAYWESQPKIIKEISNIITKYDNPEDINDKPTTAPSLRLKSLIPNYEKILYGNLIALEIGIEKILEKCPRFCQWINKIINCVQI